MFGPGRAPLNPDEALECLTLPQRKHHSAQRFVHLLIIAITAVRCVENPVVITTVRQTGVLRRPNRADSA